MATTVLKCFCKHEGQDKIHGKGIRVFNSAEKGKVWRCTVCLRELLNEKHKASSPNKPGQA